MTIIALVLYLLGGFLTFILMTYDYDKPHINQLGLVAWLCLVLWPGYTVYLLVWAYGSELMDKLKDTRYG